MIRIFLSFLTVLFLHTLSAQDSLRVFNAFCIAAPPPGEVARFIRFMKEELAPNGIRALVLRVDYDYAFESYPNLRSDHPLSRRDVKRLVAAAHETGIRLIPQINLLGHQSWAEQVTNLLRQYPQFDETPGVQMPEKYEWPNDDGLYCKSYCPLHPEVHEVVFSLVDEVMEVFEADAFHAGMDEVFYLGTEQCSRCQGKDKAELFAGEVIRIRDHLQAHGQELWIWGDRLLDGATTGLGMWEASLNDTWPAVDLIPKDVVICDWHYENAVPTPVYFATKGFRVYSCFWNRPQVTTAHMKMMDLLREGSPEKMGSRFLGSMQTVWTGVTPFLDAYYGENRTNEGALEQAESFKAMVRYLQEE